MAGGLDAVSRREAPQPQLRHASRVTLPLGPYRLAVTICFEDTIPQVIAPLLPRGQRRPPAGVLINLSNDGWFHGSAELDMHLAIGVFRAVEHRVPLARAVNTGLSALVDGNGEIRASLPKEIEGRVVGDRPARRSYELLFPLGRLAGSYLPGRHDRTGSDRHRPQTAQTSPAELTKTPEFPTLGCLPERRAWGKFGQV